jgi:flavin reductase (DIM6/NTAB) family NADH-FMN oxidoreductase RutF
MAAVEPADFRSSMSLIPTAVTVLTTAGTEGPAGATANAVSSLSLEPMLMIAALDRGSRTLLAVQEAHRFAINVLAAGQEDVARAFATKAPVAEKWEGIEWSERAGVPVLGGAVLWVACELQDVIAGGDHVIVTGEVAELEAPGGEPLLFHGGGYRPLGAA